MAEYKLLNDNYIQRTLDGACIPPDENNIDYQEYLAWVSNGGIADPADLAFEETWEGVRAKRNALLYECDWTQSIDSPLSTLEKVDWATYRQTLRDIPSTYENVEDVIWPNKP